MANLVDATTLRAIIDEALKEASIKINNNVLDLISKNTKKRRYIYTCSKIY